MFILNYRIGVSCVRGGEIFEFRDESDVILNDFTRPDERATGRMGSKRKLRLFLDPSQYYTDMKVNYIINFDTILMWDFIIF